MERTNFERLRVYQVSEKLADLIWKMVIKWDYFARRTIGQQIVDAADGVGANIAEGSGRGSLQDNRRFVKIARGSLYETKHWLRRAYKRKLLTSQEISDLRPLIEELLPTLNAYFRSLNDAIEKHEQSTKHKIPSSKVEC
jgi:four helix bundle protein